MPVDRELKQLAVTVSKKIPGDPNRPYKIRRRKSGTIDSRGKSDAANQYEYRTIEMMRTQPLADKELSRLPEGERVKSWRFVEVVANKPGELPASPDEFLNFDDEFEYKGNWYEVKMINDWDIIQGCKAAYTK
jgi:hypothetical protein